MADLLKPRDEADVREAVAWAVAERKPVEIVGQGSKRGIGRPAQADLTLDISGLSGITLYEPEELVLSAMAGTPLAEIEDALAAKSQELAFEPLGYGALLDGGSSRGSIGGVIAANASGPRRLSKGAARDHFLGVRAVSGRGEAFKSGGRVVKNVTGYDLCKGLAGSWGTLAVMTDVTVKVLPAAEAIETVLVLGLADGAAAKAMARAMGSSAEVSGAAHLPAGIAARLPAEAGSMGGQAATALRLEGFAPSVAARKEALISLLTSHGETAVIGRDASLALWRFVRDAAAFAGDRTRPVWRVSVAPTEGARFVEALGRSAEVEAFYDWAGGLVWLSVPAASDDALESTLRAAIRPMGGHATLVRAEPGLRSSVPVFEPQPEGLAGLSARLKHAFDPSGILNPGRMYPGM